jgi:hypothetical protein
MMADSCARCGRTRSSEQLPAADAPIAADSWAVLNDRVVCPDCQTVDERRQNADRIVAAILNEIDRRQRGDIPPDQYEMALGAYAMALRSLRQSPESGDDGLQAPPAPRSGSDQVNHDVMPGLTASPSKAEKGGRSPGKDGGSVLRVAITGAFLTGHPLTVHIADYARTQAELGEILHKPQWTVEHLQEVHGTYEAGGGFTTAVPLVIARRDGADLLPWLTSALGASHVIPAGRPCVTSTALNVTAVSLSMDFYDLGVGVLTAWVTVDLAEGDDLAETVRELQLQVRLRDEGDGGPALTQTLQSVVVGAIQDYSAAATSVAANASALSDDMADIDRLPLAGERGADRARLLWLHPIHVVVTENATARLAKALAPPFHQRIKFDGGTFAAGIDWSAIVALPTSTSVGRLVELTELHWAYYALYMGIDRELLHLLDRPESTEDLGLKELERIAEVVFAKYMAVINARARLDSALNARGGDDFAIWQAIADVQQFDAVVDSVERKLGALDKLARHRVDEANTYRTRRIADALGYISVLTLVTVTIAVISLLLGSRNPGFNRWWLPVPPLVAAFLVSALAYRRIYIRTMRPRPRK